MAEITTRLEFVGIFLIHNNHFFDVSDQGDSVNDKPQESYFRFQLDILMKEIDLIDNAIGRLDEILLRNRNWGITLWTGLIAIIIPLTIEDFPKSYLLLATAILPFLFWLIDIRWKMALLQCSDRQREISKFLNSNALCESYKNNSISSTSLKLLDPIGEGLKSDDGQKSSDKSYFFKAIWYKDTFIFYPAQILCSFLLILLL